MVSRNAPVDAQMNDIPPPPAYTAVATVPAQANRPELPVRVRNPQLRLRESEIISVGILGNFARRGSLC